MNGGMETGEPIGDGITYGLGFYFFLLLILFILSYTSYICKHHQMGSTSPTATGDDHHFIRLGQAGLQDDVLATFPTFPYYQAITDQADHRSIINYGSGCSICLADYKAPDVLRLLPECRHMFHAICIDMWLKVHPTCPVCRNSIQSNSAS